MTFEELYNRLLKSSVTGNFAEELDLVKQQGYDPHHLSCLLGPENHPVVIRTDACTCDNAKLEQCRARCYFDALFIEDGAVSIDPKLCVGCGDGIVPGAERTDDDGGAGDGERQSTEAGQSAGQG